MNVSPNKINQELNCLRRVMIHGRAWTNGLETDYVPFRREECSIPRAMTREEQEHFLEVAGDTERFLVLYCYSIIVFNTTCSCKEMRELRLEDVSRGDDMVYVRWGKNKYRTRSMPLKEDGRWAVYQLLERARWLGCTAPEHYLFPSRVRYNEYDPTRHICDYAMVRPWKELREAVGFPWLQINVLRHTALTRYAEDGMPTEMLVAYAGHMSIKMTRHYMQIGNRAKLKHMGAMAAFVPPPFSFAQPCLMSNGDVPPRDITQSLQNVEPVISNQGPIPTSNVVVRPGFTASRFTWELTAHFGDLAVGQIPITGVATQHAPQSAPRQPDVQAPGASAIATPNGQIIPIRHLEREAIINALRQLKGDKIGAAKKLGISKNTLYLRLTEYGIRCCEWQYNCNHRHAPDDPNTDPVTWQGPRSRKKKPSLTKG